MGTSEIEASIIELETRFVHQESIISDLNESILQQWEQIDKLSRIVVGLEDRVLRVIESSQSHQHEQRPPHY
ncbi:MAG: SlyX family protein [Rhodospirillales bacterium]|jgi:uncharacterized coiled-coil protein SlyX|nr:SlyX family protein [Rhodospirillales bacterium]MDC0988995.1 SlyX family protein [Rhodospirillales bacterium]